MADEKQAAEFVAKKRKAMASFQAVMGDADEIRLRVMLESTLNGLVESLAFIDDLAAQLAAANKEIERLRNDNEELRKIGFSATII